MGQVRIGISGWAYPPWRGNFYPPGLPQKHELAYASRRFSALEINGTFYSLQKPKSFESWYAQTPPGFVFAMKGHKRITHERRLKDVAAPLSNFCASGPLALREKLGPVLWQFPPFMRFDAGRFRAFFELLPRDTAEMARLAENHEPWMKGRAETEADAKRPVRHAVEFRHESFMTEEFVELLREFNVAMVVADAASKFPTAEDVTADWVYVRLHGSRQLYVSGYSPEEIARWAEKIRAWMDGGEPAKARRISGSPGPKAPAGGREVYVFFDNTDVKQRAPIDARAMAEQLGAGPAATPEAIFDELGVKPRAGVSREVKASTVTGVAPHHWGSDNSLTKPKAKASANEKNGQNAKAGKGAKAGKKAAAKPAVKKKARRRA